MELQPEVFVLGHLVDCPMIEGVGVVQESRVARAFQGCEPGAGRVAPFDCEHFEPGLAEVGLKDQAVVPGAQDDAVVGGLRGAQRGDSGVPREMEIGCP